MDFMAEIWSFLITEMNPVSHLGLEQKFPSCQKNIVLTLKGMMRLAPVITRFS
jgi:hypothetical protein